jgi:hypothetical protein
MAILGVPYKVIYEALNLTSGLTDITVEILSPSGVSYGPFALTEEAGASGLYSYDFATSSNGVEGEWVSYIHSPSEGIRTAARISLHKATGAGGPSGIVSEIRGHVIKNEMLTGVISQNKISAKIIDNKLKGIVGGDAKVVGTVINGIVIGVVK